MNWKFLSHNITRYVYRSLLNLFLLFCRKWAQEMDGNMMICWLLLLYVKKLTFVSDPRISGLPQKIQKTVAS